MTEGNQVSFGQRKAEEWDNLLHTERERGRTRETSEEAIIKFQERDNFIKRINKIL